MGIHEIVSVKYNEIRLHIIYFRCSGNIFLFYNLSNNVQNSWIGIFQKNSDLMKIYGQEGLIPSRQPFLVRCMPEEIAGRTPIPLKWRIKIDIGFTWAPAARLHSRLRVTEVSLEPPFPYPPAIRTSTCIFLHVWWILLTAIENSS